jgi:DNA-3-methyladenine glycosylase I
MSTDLVVGEDGLARCRWGASVPEYVDYHDREWATPVHGESALYERLSLEGFQSGLSWLTILRKREAFRTAFGGFDADQVAGWGPAEEARLLADAGIVRNRAKIVATLGNARAVVRLRQEWDGGLDALVWSFAPDRPGPAPRSMTEVPTVTPESTALARALRRYGIRFVGPTTAYATMQACGLVNDHLDGCHVRQSP